MRLPLAAALALSLGASAGAVLGPFLLGWGLAAGPPVACVLFALGAVQDPDERLLPTALATLAALAIGFALASATVTWLALEGMPRAELQAYGHVAPVGVRQELLPRWAALLCCPLVALIGFRLRARRLRDSV